MNQMTQKIRVAGIVAFAIAVAILLWNSLSLLSVRLAEASAPSGLEASLGTSSLIQVGSTSATVIFDPAPGCAARVITTVERAIRISFGKGAATGATTTPTGQIGHIQAASTTVAYDGGIYGCGNWLAWGYELSASVPSTTIFKDEFR